MNAEAIETSTNCCISGEVIIWRVVGVLMRPIRNAACGAASYSIHASRAMPSSSPSRTPFGPPKPWVETASNSGTLMIDWRNVE